MILKILTAWIIKELVCTMIRIWKWVKYSRIKNQNLQCVTVAAAHSQRSDPIHILHGTLSYGRRRRYEILVRCDFDIFGAFRLFAACIIFLAKDFCLDPTVCGIWLILYLCSTISYRGKKIWDWFAFVCINEENIENFGLGRIMMSGGLDYSSMKNQNLQCVTVAIACGQRSDPFYMLHDTLS